MTETKFIISEKQILNAVKYALELNIQESRIVDILMHDVEDEIETVLYDDCEEYKAESEDKSVSAILDDMKSGVDGLIDDGLKMIEKRKERINENT